MANKKEIRGTEEEKKTALKTLKKRYEAHLLPYKDYVLQTKLIEKYWVIAEPEVEEVHVDENNTPKVEPTSAGTPSITLGDMVTREKPLDLTGAFGK